jgi:hypothetical protein
MGWCAWQLDRGLQNCKRPCTLVFTVRTPTTNQGEATQHPQPK